MMLFMFLSGIALILSILFILANQSKRGVWVGVLVLIFTPLSLLICAIIDDNKRQYYILLAVFILFVFSSVLTWRGVKNDIALFVALSKETSGIEYKLDSIQYKNGEIRIVLLGKRPVCFEHIHSEGDRKSSIELFEEKVATPACKIYPEEFKNRKRIVLILRIENSNDEYRAEIIAPGILRKSELRRSVVTEPCANQQ